MEASEIKPMLAPYRSPSRVPSRRVAVLFASLILVAYGTALFVMFSLFIRRYEEPRPAREFGDEYAA